ncbi:hypothetical protein N8E89_27035 (plasmid) [Phyllobacterium sp. A18/5-2]|uniref:hypothetical protein n=1 Tax=Phyllobacterium sp. A18/5-2 TaxID=2978392 RepID=UPI0021C5D5FB|nr:hypothetical protein [Phyllobacterium sp. A18/5-2]UXN67601.1 hypothetical protein N8E89_27035 [Phyllobacterium sp. A18/5-2]
MEDHVAFGRDRLPAGAMRVAGIGLDFGKIDGELHRGRVIAYNDRHIPRMLSIPADRRPIDCGGGEVMDNTCAEPECAAVKDGCLVQLPIECCCHRLIPHPDADLAAPWSGNPHRAGKFI